MGGDFGSIIRVFIEICKLIQCKQVFLKGVFQVCGGIGDIIRRLQHVCQRMPAQVVSGIHGSCYLGKGAESLFFRRKIAEFMFLNIRTVLIKGAGICGVFYQSADDGCRQIDS